MTLATSMPAMPSEAPILSLRGVSRDFDDGGHVAALRSVDLDIWEGELLAIVGPSGSGKSTLLNILGLLDRPTAGRYVIRGRDVSDVTEGHRNRLRATTFGFVFQSSHLVGSFSAAANAAVGLEIEGVERTVRVQRVTHALDTVGMRQRASTSARNLSGGERQRIAVARAIATGPEIILADEPTGSLDSASSSIVIDHLEALNRAGTTVVIITHDSAVAARAHRRIEIRDGVVLDVDVDVTMTPRAAAVDAPPVDSATRSSHVLRRPRRARRLRALGLEVAAAVSAHTTAPIRSLALVFAFLLGAGGLVSASGISQSAAAQVADRLTQAALDEVVIEDNLTRGPDSVASVAEIESEVRKLAAVVGVGWSANIAPSDGVVTLLPPGSLADQPRFAGQSIVVDAAYLDVIDARVEPIGVASLFTGDELGLLAVLGVDAAEELGISTVGPGVRIWFNGAPVEVVGLVSGGSRDPLLSSSVVFSPAAAELAVSAEARFTVRTEPGYPASVADALPLALSAANPGRVHLSTVADLRSLRMGVADDLGFLIAIVSWILLALSTLSAGATMFVSVRSRASEVALRRALGASRASIWRRFSFEGLIIGSAGGIAGSVVGLVSVVVVCASQGWTAVLDPTFLIIGVVAGAASGLVSAVYPALVAAFSNPASAIRS